jgi:hypothetical protein
MNPSQQRCAAFTYGQSPAELKPHDSEDTGDLQAESQGFESLSSTRSFHVSPGAIFTFGSDRLRAVAAGRGVVAGGAWLLPDEDAAPGCADAGAARVAVTVISAAGWLRTEGMGCQVMEARSRGW